MIGKSLANYQMTTELGNGGTQRYELWKDES